MEISRPIRLLPTMPMLADCLSKAGWDCQMYLSDANRSYRGIRLYHGQQLHQDVLYLLRPTETDFPFYEYSYISTADLNGQANHLICPDRPDEEILDQLLEVFSQFRTWEDSIDLLLYSNSGLQDLCELGAQLLENPVCIHDDWFVMMAMTADFAHVMEPEYMMSSAKGFVPRAVVEDFQYDSDYLETYTHHDARIWCPSGKDQYSLYANLWDGAVYKGRFLVARKNRDFRPQDFLLAEVLAQRAVLLLRRKPLGNVNIHQNMDDIIFALLQGKQTRSSDLNPLLDMLRWRKTDRFLCLRLQPQQNTATMMIHMLHSDLFRAFPGSYVLLCGQEQCVILDLSRAQVSIHQIHHQLAPLCRDYCLYAGISSPVVGIRELNSAYYQAGVALEQTFRLRNEKWILNFSECLLDHIVRTLPAPLSPSHLVAPELIILMAWDQEKGTQYFETLREYLLQERNIPRTSEALIIHRTTLLYRLKNIQSLIHVNLEDPWKRLSLIMSLWILEYGNKQ